MQYINKIEIMGRIGTIRIQEILKTKVANFSVATEEIYNNPSGSVCAELTWHQVVAWQSNSVNPNLFQASKGDCVHVVGRVRQSKYTTVDGREAIFQQIIASEVKLLNTDKEC